MPLQGTPPQSHAGQDHTGTQEPYYSNEDVAVLHEIVNYAQELFPKLPERERLPTNALFTAYYDILPRLGINADHDSRYARVLFKIGGLRGQGTLYEKFEEILSRMGIEIEFDHEGNEEYSQVDDSQHNLDFLAADELHPQDEDQDPPRHRRRNSESSAWEGGLDLRSQPGKRRNSASSIAKDKYQAVDFQNVLQEARSPQQQLPLRTTNLETQKEDSPAHSIGSWLRSRPDKPRRGRNRSISTHGSMRIRRRSLSGARRPAYQSVNPSFPASEDFQALSEITAVTSQFGDDTTSDLAIPAQRYLSEQDADGLMQIKASLKFQHHLSSFSKCLLRHWRDRAQQLRQDNIYLESLASSHDKKALLQSALDSWRLLSLQRHQVAETERFFAHIERRAARARDLYLMHVAFTHWSTYADEQVQRTALARRHIVRTRIFNAWRDITAVNELKVRRQVLKKFFSLWKHSYSVAAKDINYVVQKYEGHLVERIFKQWVQQLRILKATAWCVEGTKRRTLFQWIVASHHSWEAHGTAEEKRRLQLTWRAWRIWRTKANTQAGQHRVAEQYRQDHIRLVPLRKWRHETQMVPAKTTVQTDVSRRLLRGAFETWLHRTRQEKTAETVDRLKILQEALTNWQYKSRTRLVRSRIDKNTKTTAIYRWIVARRCSERRQKVGAEVLVGCFHAWIRRMRPLREITRHQEALARSFMLQKTQDVVFRHWYSRMDGRQQLETVARNFRTPRVLGKVVSKWSEQSEHLQQLQSWSQDAKFYFLATKAVNRWRASAETSKREKRKAGYAQVRRMVKINSARRVLCIWLDKAKHAIDLQARAREMSQNRNIIIGMDIFDRWRARTEEVTEFESLWRINVLKKQFKVWRDRSNASHAYEKEAIMTYQERRQWRAIKKWSLVTLQLRAQTHYAGEVCEKNAKRTFRKMFTYWHQKAAQRRPKKNDKITYSIIPPAQLGVTARAEAWSDFGDDPQIDEWVKGVDDATVATPIPGYLSTPSKRTERVLAVAAKFSTTPKAPLSTPFERHLRTQWSGGLLPAPRKERGKSNLSTGEGFEDIVNSSANHEL